MPLDERDRKELAEKINNQRRSMWKGQKTDNSKLKRKQERESSASQTQDQLDKPKLQLKIPGLKLSLLVIISLIAAILLGVCIGYLIAAKDLIRI